MSIHPAALVDKDAELGSNVVVGPNTVIERGVVIGDETQIGACALICEGTRIGSDNKIFHGAVIGTPPQDLKFKGEPSGVVIGDRNTIREYVTIHRASGEGGVTRLGNDCYLMVGAHLGHNSVVEDRVVLTNTVALGGYARVGADAVMGGLSGAHQFVVIGPMAMIGGLTAITRDVPPFMLVAGGSNARVKGLNQVGLMRKIKDEKSRENLKKAFRMLYRSEDVPQTALAEVEAQLGADPYVRILVDFLQSPTERGFCKFEPWKSGSRNAD